MNENTLYVEKIFKTFLNKIYFTKMSKIFCIWLYKATLVAVLAIVAQVSSVALEQLVSLEGIGKGVWWGHNTKSYFEINIYFKNKIWYECLAKGI